MATSSLYGNSSESIGLYGIGSASGGTYFEWFIFYDSATAPATPTGGSWSFTTNTGTTPTGWLASPPASPSNLIWVSIAIVDSRSTAALTWSVPGLMAASGLPVLTGSGVPSAGTGVNGQLYINTATTPQSMYNKQSGSWVQITGSNLVDLVNNQTIGGIKTFSSPIVGSVTGTAGNVSGVVAIANGGTNASTASAARTNLGLGTISTQDASSVAITGGSITGITDLAVADGGTGASTAANARTNLGAVGLTDTQTLTNKTISGASNTLTNIGNSSLTNSSVTINGSGISLGGSVTITAATPNNLVFGSGLSATGNFNGSVATNVTLANVGTAATYGDSGTIPVFTTNAFGQIASVSLQSVVVDSADISGTIAIAQGGTGASSAANARVNLLPSYAGNGGKIFALNAGATDVEWRAVTGTGTVSSVAVSGGTTGLTTSGGPITAAGTITIGGTLAVGSGGTGVTTSTGSGSVVLSTGASLTNPIINQINDSNNNEILGLSPTASATDFVTVKNGIGVGVPLHVYADGPSANIGLHLQPKGTGLITISDGTDFNKGIRFRSSGSAASAITLLDAVSTAGRVVTLPDATTTLVGRDTTDTLTNKTIAFGSNTFSGTLGTTNGGTGLGGATPFTSGGVVYASSTSALATGSALQFDGTSFAVGGSAYSSSTISANYTTPASGSSKAMFGSTDGTKGFQLSQTGSAYSYAGIGANELWYYGTSNYSALTFGSDGNVPIKFVTNGSEGMRLTSTGLGIGTSSPPEKLSLYSATSLGIRMDSPDNIIRFMEGATAKGYIRMIGGATNRLDILNNGNGMYVDSSGNVGIGSVPSAWSGYQALQTAGGSMWGSSNLGILTTNTYFSSGYKYATTNFAEMYQQSSGAHTWHTAASGTAGNAITFTQAMTLDASRRLMIDTTSIGIGGSGFSLLNVGGAQASSFQSIKASGGEELILGVAAGAAFMGSFSNTALNFRSNNTNQMTLSTAGNLGLGVTPSAWFSTIRAMQIGNGAVLEGRTNSAFVAAIGTNYYLEATAATNTYIATGTATKYQQITGAHQWYTAASGTAGTAISFTQAMTLDSSGILLLAGMTSSIDANVKFQINTASGAQSYIGINRAGTYGLLVGYDNYGGSDHGNVRTVGAYPLVLGTSNVEKARITSAGYFKASNAGTYQGSTGSYHELVSNVADATVKIANTNASPYGLDIIYTAASPNSTGNAFLYCADNVGQRATIRSNGGLANYSANDVNLSDRREKTNFAPAGSYLDKICAIPVQTFNYIDQNLETDAGLTLGVVAQDVQAIAPELVMESDWGTEEDPKMRLSIYQTDLQYALMKAIQELKAEFDAYKASHP